MDSYTISLEANPAPQDIQAIVHNLVNFNSLWAEPERSQLLAIFVRAGIQDDTQEIVGGLLGYTHWNWLFVSHLWIAEHLRGIGYGKQLISRAENEAIQRGCHHAHVDTFSFQARGFYEALGYQVFGTLDDYPHGHKRYFLQKRNLIRHGTI